VTTISFSSFSFNYDYDARLSYHGFLQDTDPQQSSIKPYSKSFHVRIDRKSETAHPRPKLAFLQQESHWRVARLLGIMRVDFLQLPSVLNIIGLVLCRQQNPLTRLAL
jgi:hypothetical protein